MEDMGGAYYHHYPPPLPDYHRYPPPPTPPPNHGVDEVRTLFVAGLPHDAKLRELYNLFADFPGYVSSQLNSSSQGFGFVVFSDQPSALAAMRALNGMVFDLEKDSILHIDLAKSNSRPKRSRAAENAGRSDKRSKGYNGPSKGLLDPGVGSYDHMSGMENTDNTYPFIQSLGSIDHHGADDFDHRRPLLHSLPSYIQQNIVPCATLFVANLGPRCTESELMQIFARCPGFLKLKMQHKQGAPVAFVDFKDISSSTRALSTLHGIMLGSSDGEGLRIEYAKSRMGLKKRERTRSKSESKASFD